MAPAPPSLTPRSWLVHKHLCSIYSWVMSAAPPLKLPSASCAERKNASWARSGWLLKSEYPAGAEAVRPSCDPIQPPPFPAPGDWTRRLCPCRKSLHRTCQPITHRSSEGMSGDFKNNWPGRHCEWAASTVSCASRCKAASTPSLPTTTLTRHCRILLAGGCSCRNHVPRLPCCCRAAFLTDAMTSQDQRFAHARTHSHAWREASTSRQI